MTPDDAAADLDEFEVDQLLDHPEAVANFGDPPESLFPDGWNEDLARSLTRRRQRLAKELAVIADAAAKERERIRAWEEDRSAGLKRRLAWLEDQLEGWQRAVGKTTFVTPWATSRLRDPRSHVEVTDAEAFVAWAIVNRYWALLKVEPAKSMVGKMQPANVIEDWPKPGETAHALVDEGEVAPGVVIVTPTEKNWSIS